ncbi:hypothetical protein XENOCAPTIV_022572, partial [Xenoophorus captivus]
VCNPGEGGKGISMSMTNVHSQTNGQQSQGCTVTASSSKHGSIGLDDLSAGSHKRSGVAAAGGGHGEKDTITQSFECSLPDCSTATSVLSQSWGAQSPTAGGEDREKICEQKPLTGIESPTTATGSLHKSKRKPAPRKPRSACSNTSAMPENRPPASSPRPPSSTPTSALLPLTSSTPLENLNTNRNNSTSLNKTPPPPFVPSTYSTSLPTPSSVSSMRFRETPILRRAPRAISSSAKYQTLPTEEGGRSRARRRYSLSEEGSKTHSPLQRAGGAPKLGRVMRNKRSQSMSGMLLSKEEDGDSKRGRCESDWILESTV